MMVMEAEGSDVTRARRWTNCAKEGKYQTRATQNIHKLEWIIKLCPLVRARVRRCARACAPVAAPRESAEQKRAWLTPLLEPEGARTIKKTSGRKFERAAFVTQ